MNIKAIVTALVLGSSSLAVAAPSGSTVRDHRAPTAAPSLTPKVRDHRAPIAAPMRAPASAYVGFRASTRPILSWVTLANDTQLSGRTLIKVAPTARKFTKLELRADRGRASIDKVMIVFANGRSQIVNLDAKLTKQRSAVSIDLAGNARSIDRIVLVGRTMGRRAAVDVRAI